MFKYVRHKVCAARNLQEDLGDKVVAPGHVENPPPVDNETEWQPSQPLLSSQMIEWQATQHILPSSMPSVIEILHQEGSQAESVVLGTDPGYQNGQSACLSVLPTQKEADNETNVPETQETMSQVAKKCSMRGCRVTNAPTFACIAQDCSRIMHMQCYSSMCTKNRLSLFEGDCVVCTKSCYNKHMRRLKIEKQEEEEVLTLNWEKDGKGGVDDPSNSMSVLLNWWTTVGNYAKYRGDSN